ncbi:MAG TPA: hypothetical protein VGL86_07235 [Polyangia bacterium]
MRLEGGAPDLAASVDGVYVACAGAKLTLSAQATRAAIAAVPLDGPADVAFVGADRLLALVRGDERTRLDGYALPSLELVATLELDDRLVVLAATGGRALIATENLEQPRVVAVTTKIVIDTIGLREPLLLATAAPEDRLLAASRTREAQIECWDPFLRRALFRLNLPLLPNAQLAGFSARRRLLWIAAGGASGTLEVFRFSDGRLQARVELGAAIVGAAGHPDSSRLVVATRPSDGAAVELTELDFQAGERRPLSAPVAPRAMCVVEGEKPALVMVSGDEPPTWMALGAAATEGKASAAPATAATKTVHPRVTNAADWRGKLQATKAAAGATGATATATATATAAAALAPAEAEHAPHWRDELCDWAEQQLAAPRRMIDAPVPSDDSPLATVVGRLALDERSARALAFVYGARLLGHADLPAATVARALGDGDADAWDEALGHGLAGRLGLVHARGGRVALSAPAGRFLDGAAPRLPIVAGSASDAELPAGAVRLDGGVEPLGEIGSRLARQYGYDVALVLVEGAAPARMLAWKLVEARLHGAWPVIDVSTKGKKWAHALDDGPCVVIVRGDEVPAAIATLPAL